MANKPIIQTFIVSLSFKMLQQIQYFVIKSNLINARLTHDVYEWHELHCEYASKNRCSFN